MTTATNKSEISTEERLKALYALQIIDSDIDRIRTVRGELPLEVQDLEDEVEGLATRINNFIEEVSTIEGKISEKSQLIKESKATIKKYEVQQNSVRNNREFDSITKEIEYQNLEIQLAEKRTKEYKAQIAAKKEIISASMETLEGRKNDLEHKKSELDTIIKETENEEALLIKKSEQAQTIIKDRLLKAYSRIRNSARNGLAVVTVQRDACGGCYNKIPPQRQLDIRTRMKIIVCEHCGRILVDSNINGDKEGK